MKRFISYLLVVVFLLILTMPFALAADERKNGLFSYTMKGNGSAIIVGFDAAANGNNDIYVPSQIDGYTVSEIGTEAFKNVNCECVVMLPDTITTIGEEAFYGSSFTMVNIPASVKEIKTDALSHMANIKKMTVDSQNTVYATIDGVLYNKQTKTLVACPYNDNWSWSSSEITIPNGILTIGEGAFADFGDLTINMPASLLTISDRAFERADLEEESISIPYGVESIGERAFYHSNFYMSKNGERGIYLPSSVKSLGKEAFAESYGYCFANSNQNYHFIDLGDTQLVEIPEAAFRSVKSIEVEAVYLPETLKVIGDRAFVCVEVGTRNGLNLPATVESIGEYAFSSGSGKFSFSDGSNLKNIGNKAFRSFEFIDAGTTLVLPDGLESIGEEAFIDIKGIERIVIPESVTFIGNNFCNRADIVLDIKPGSYAEFWASENGYTTNLETSEELDWLADTAIPESDPKEIYYQEKIGIIAEALGLAPEVLDTAEVREHIDEYENMTTDLEFVDWTVLLLAAGELVIEGIND